MIVLHPAQAKDLPPEYLESPDVVVIDQIWGSDSMIIKGKQVDPPKHCPECGKGPSYIEHIDNNVFVCKCRCVIKTNIDVWGDK